MKRLLEYVAVFSAFALYFLIACLSLLTVSCVALFILLCVYILAHEIIYPNIFPFPVNIIFTGIPISAIIFITCIGGLEAMRKINERKQK